MGIEAGTLAQSRSFKAYGEDNLRRGLTGQGKQACIVAFERVAQFQDGLVGGDGLVPQPVVERHAS